MKDLVQKARAVVLNPYLKGSLYDVAAELVPFSQDLEADRTAYEASKKAFDASKQDMKTFERMCELYGTKQGRQEPCFLPGFDEDAPTHGFTKWVLKVAKDAEIEKPKIKANLIAFLAYTADKVATIAKRKRGWASGGEVRGDLEMYTNWAGGIQRAKAFMSKASRCPTT